MLDMGEKNSLQETADGRKGQGRGWLVEKEMQFTTKIGRVVKKELTAKHKPRRLSLNTRIQIHC